jgi:cytochrome c peroxidase
VRADIGHRLFRDPRLSANGKVSCASCHDARQGGADGRARSEGFSGLRPGVNAPTVFNAALNFKQFWNGRADSLEAQIDMVVQNPVEMGSRWEDVVAKVAADPQYRSAFAGAYRDGVTKANIRYQLGPTPSKQDTTAIVQFLNTLTGELGGRP